jgi:hypothetical protein
MPNTDLIKLALIAVLVAAIVGLVAWFATTVVDDVVSTGALARVELSSHGAEGWEIVTDMFGTAWNTAWDMALAIALGLLSLLFLFRVIKWVNGA